MNTDKIIKFIKLVEENKFTLKEWDYLASIINTRFDLISGKVIFTVDDAVLTLYGKKDLFKTIEKRQ
ncbi:MAG TPA: hypothetical protein IAD49_03550 [Candidatus Fimihabitans intestinipullorum]|uniref:Uncharacterized protein n=1 Tax=Candidatus Fimihabitans intestinipullorum TaxID=2840820 RepID=A0A9D1HUP7_9BACT|nr:hypothetical protein [Candidatus Fimihabitans intestinipullorum]